MQVEKQKNYEQGVKGIVRIVSEKGIAAAVSRLYIVSQLLVEYSLKEPIIA